MSRTDGPVALSLVVPVFDEKDNLDALVREIVEVLGGHAGGIEILLVDDGSRDGSSERIHELSRADPRVRGVHLRANCGQTAALDAGFKAARGRFVVTLDADLQYDPRDIPALLAALEHHDAAVGYRVKREDSWDRRVSSRVANFVRDRLSGDDVIDTCCSLKAFRRECLAELRLYRGLHRFLPTLLRLEGRRVAQLPVRHRPRRSGQSKYGIGNRAFGAFADLLAVRWMKKRRLDYEVLREEP